MTVGPTIAVLNGPNLNLLGTREPARYGTDTLADVEELCRRTATEVGYGLDFRQTNHEGELVELVQDVRETASGVVLNAGAYSHTSIAVRDALATVAAPVIELHLTNVHAREGFRHHSYVAGLAAAVIAGCGPAGYAFAIRHLAALDASTTGEVQRAGR